MNETKDDAVRELQRIEKENQVISKLSECLEELEEKMKQISQTDQVQPSSTNSEDLQKIILKITSLRELIDRVEIEIDQLNSRIDGIESLRFKHRTEK